MIQKPQVYVSRITNLSDARYCAGMGVDMLGFMVDPASSDYVSPVEYQAMVGWISGPSRVIEVNNTKTADWSKILEDYKPDLVHIKDLTEEGKYPDLPIILEIPFSDLDQRISEIGKRVRIQYILITQLPQVTEMALPKNDHSMLLSVDDYSGSLKDLLRQSGARGVAMRGSRELAPGLQDYDHLSRVLEDLEN